MPSGLSAWHSLMRETWLPMMPTRRGIVFEYGSPERSSIDSVRAGCHNVTCPHASVRAKFVASARGVTSRSTYRPWSHDRRPPVASLSTSPPGRTDPRRSARRASVPPRGRSSRRAPGTARRSISSRRAWHIPHEHLPFEVNAFASGASFFNSPATTARASLLAQARDTPRRPSHRRPKHRRRRRRSDDHRPQQSERIAGGNHVFTGCAVGQKQFDRVVGKVAANPLKRAIDLGRSLPARGSRASARRASTPKSIARRGRTPPAAVSRGVLTCANGSEPIARAKTCIQQPSRRARRRPRPMTAIRSERGRRAQDQKQRHRRLDKRVREHTGDRQMAELQPEHRVR